VLLPVAHRLCRRNVQPNPDRKYHQWSVRAGPHNDVETGRDGAIPAIVIMHDCSGLGPRSSGAPMRWARNWSREDMSSLYRIASPRAAMPVEFVLTRHRVETTWPPARRAADAYAALSYLRTLPYVDGSRIGIMGGSHGGSTTLASVVAPEREKEPLAQEKRTGFSAAVALYPGCAARLGAGALCGKPGELVQSRVTSACTNPWHLY
jgi:dienelactone hydrolase